MQIPAEEDNTFLNLHKSSHQVVNKFITVLHTLRRVQGLTRLKISEKPNLVNACWL